KKDSICWQSVKMRLGRRTSRWVVVVTMGRHGLRRPILENSSSALFITLDSRYDGSSHSQRSVKGLRSITLDLLEFGYWDYFSDLHDEPEGRTVMATMVRHALRNPTLGETSPSSFRSFTMMPPTDRHRLDGPSQAP
ncbi:hypothetical protein EJD97_001096, partial [Solanum chilense]